MNSGIYRIINIINNKFYFGQAKSFTIRKKKHFIALNGNYHSNLRLQNAFNKYGKDNFIFEIDNIISARAEIKKDKWP